LLKYILCTGFEGSAGSEDSRDAGPERGESQNAVPARHPIKLQKFAWRWSQQQPRSATERASEIN